MWFDHVALKTDYNYICSRIRLARNIDSFVFPSRQDKANAKKLVDTLVGALKGIDDIEEVHTGVSYLHKMSEVEKMTLRDRRIINSAIVAKKEICTLIKSEEEDLSIVINGDDHIRLQVMGTGQCLQELYERADRIDNYINERFDYAFHEKYGYLTSYPTNVGTGMRANIVVHLPLSSQSSGFSKLVSGIGRLGVSMRGLYGEGSENYGALYDISNPKTLGQSEKDIIEQIMRVATQLNFQESQLRRDNLKEHRLSCQDEAYKSFGVLKYARKITLKDALIYLSAIMQGMSDHLIKVKQPEAIYALMLGIQASNILFMHNKPMNNDEIDEARAKYIRENLSLVVE